MPQTPHPHPGKWLVLLIIMLAILVTPAQAQGNQHVVQPGETLYRIALRYNVTVDDLTRANSLLNPNQVYAGQVLVIPGQVVENVDSAASNAPVYHIVQPGETLGTIAQQYAVDWRELAAQNNITDINRILVGQQLVVMTTAAPATAATAPIAEALADAPQAVAALPEPATNPDQPATTHIVQAGEHLASIARQYGVSWPSLAAANNIVDPNQLYAGQALVIPGRTAEGVTPGTYLDPAAGQPAGPTPTITNGKQIIVDLSEQQVYAYQDGQLVHTVTVSTGLPGSPTVTGDFNIYWKLDAQTMYGPGYYLPGVPWVMYFFEGYALHGTYWHSNFGQPMSHGCVNLPTDDAAWFYTFAEVGTPVRVVN